MKRVMVVERLCDEVTEHMLSLYLDEHKFFFTIHVLTPFLPKRFQPEWKQYMQRVVYTIEGKCNRVFIVCDPLELSYEQAEKVAVQHVKGGEPFYRLDQHNI